MQNQPSAVKGKRARSGGHEGAQEFSAKESEFQINTAMRSLLSALQTEKKF
jgi:hypothetical protein